MATRASPRLSTHFLPKFDNASDGQRLASDAACAGTARCLAVTKKHSGHLVMAPPFYSKNGTANRYSRMGELLLRAHFGAAWGERGDERFRAWWAHAEESGLSYSFECVVPRVLGDHGATPLAAYMVLTCVAHVGGGGFLSPAELLRLATSWALPLNEAWFVPWARAAEVEERLGEVLEGFVLMALDVDPLALAPLIAAYEDVVAPAREAVLAEALRLGEACSSRAPWLLDALDRKSAAEPERVAMGAEEAWAIAFAGDDAGGGSEAAHDAARPIRRLFRMLHTLYAHRVHLKVYMYRGSMQMQLDVTDDQIFFGSQLHTLVSATSPLYRGMVVTFDAAVLPSLGSALASLPAHTHTALEPMAVDAAQSPKRPRAEDAASRPAEATPIPSARVLGISKLKCLNYLRRTFGVRNLLPSLLDGGPAAYLAATERFYKNWSVPPEHREGLTASFTGWAQEVSRMAPAEVTSLRNGEYLGLLEGYLSGHRRGEGEGFGLERFCLMVVNLTGEPLPPAVLEEYAPRMHQLASAKRGERAPQPFPGSVSVMEQPPGGRLLAEGNYPTLVLLLPPLPSSPPKWHKMWAACNGLEFRFPHLAGRVLIRPDPAEWRAIVSSLATALAAREPSFSSSHPSAHSSATLPAASAAASSSGLDASALAQPPPRAAPTVRTVVAIVALPPGGGKSSLFEGLRGGGGFIVSSDEERHRNGSFDASLGQALRRHHLVCYDKNIPDATGLAKLIKVLGGIERQLRIQVNVLLVAPSSLEHDLAWRRVASRPASDIALNIHTVQGGEREAYRIFRGIFFEACLRFLPYTHSLPGTLVTAAFWESLKASRDLAHEILSTHVLTTAVPLATLKETLDSHPPTAPRHGPPHAAGTGQPPPNAHDPAGAFAPFGPASTAHEPGGSGWLAAEIPGTKLHLTLVPPPSSHRGGTVAEQLAAAEQTAAFRRLRPTAGAWVSIALLRYILVTSGGGDAGGTAEGGGGGANGGERMRRLGFWEVASVSGIPEELQYAPQRQIYHVTDTASLIHTAPREAAEVLAALRRGDLPAEWAVSTLPLDDGQQPPAAEGAARVAAQVRVVS